MSLIGDDHGVTPVVATLALILVAIVGALSIAYLLGALSTDVSDYVTAPGATPTPGPQILIVDSPGTYPVDRQLAQRYMASHGGVRVNLQSSPDEFTSASSLSANISDIVALSKAPSSSLLFKDPNIQTHFIAGRAVVMIANTDMNIPAVSQSDMSKVYSLTPQSMPVNLTGLTTVVRNDDGQGSEMIFAEWLTGDIESSLENYMATPAGVQNYTAHSEAEVISKVSSMTGAIGFVYWGSVLNNDPSVSHFNVIPIINKNNQMAQMPSDSAIKNELACMNNSYYDEGLIGGLYYLTEGLPETLVQSYIDWCRGADAAVLIHEMGMYGAADLNT